MILRTPEEAAHEFAEWAALFCSKVFVQITVYADESETQDGTVQGGVSDLIICGVISTLEDWKQSSARWLAVLEEYKAPYFHFYEWETASWVARKKPERPPSSYDKNPYKHLNAKDLDDFLFKLSEAAQFENKLLCSVLMPIKKFHEAKLKGEAPVGFEFYEYGAWTFFRSCLESIHDQRPLWKGEPISFFFDQGGKEHIWSAISHMYRLLSAESEAFKHCGQSDDIFNPPLQAADMVVYRVRQLTAKTASGEHAYGNWKPVDDAIAKLLLSFKP